MLQTSQGSTKNAKIGALNSWKIYPHSALFPDQQNLGGVWDVLPNIPLTIKPRRMLWWRGAAVCFMNQPVDKCTQKDVLRHYMNRIWFFIRLTIHMVVLCPPCPNDMNAGSDLRRKARTTTRRGWMYRKGSRPFREPERELKKCRSGTLLTVENKRERSRQRAIKAEWRSPIIEAN